MLYQAVNGDYVLPTGKHKDKTVDQVLAMDPQYLQWALDEKKLFVTKQVFARLQEAMVIYGVLHAKDRESLKKALDALEERGLKRIIYLEGIRAKGGVANGQDDLFGPDPSED